VELKSGLFSFQRDGDTSMIADKVMGINGFYFGARKEYYDSQLFYHKSGKTLRYTNDRHKRPFPVPALMTPERKELIARNSYIDVVIAGDFRQEAPELNKVIERVKFFRAQGKRVGLVETYDYDLEAKNLKEIAPVLRAEIDGDKVLMLVFGDSVSCKIHLGSLNNRYAPNVTKLTGEKS